MYYITFLCAGGRLPPLRHIGNISKVIPRADPLHKQHFRRALAVQGDTACAELFGGPAVAGNCCVAEGPVVDRAAAAAGAALLQQGLPTAEALAEREGRLRAALVLRGNIGPITTVDAAVAAFTWLAGNRQVPRRLGADGDQAIARSQPLKQLPGQEVAPAVIFAAPAEKAVADQ